jgi:hypothetical protein
LTVKKHLRRAGDRTRELPGLRASTRSIPAAPSCRLQDEVFPDREHFRLASSKPGARSAGEHSLRSPSSWARARPAARTCRR